MNTQSLNLSDIEDAARRIAPRAVRTPTISSPHLNQLIDARIYLKLELLQQTGSFKFRGAFNRLQKIPLSERHRGVVAWSSGNHAQGVALAAQQLHLPEAERYVVPTQDGVNVGLTRYRGGSRGPRS